VFNVCGLAFFPVASFWGWTGQRLLPGPSNGAHHMLHIILELDCWKDVIFGLALYLTGQVLTSST
jgi:hypothetical protein